VHRLRSQCMMTGGDFMQVDRRMFVSGAVAAMSGLANRATAGAQIEPGYIAVAGTGSLVSADQHMINASFDPDGSGVWFTSADQSWDRSRIHRASITAAGWRDEGPLSFSVGPWRDTDPLISPDGKLLLFASDRPYAGRSWVPKAFDYRLWQTAREPGGWGAPQPLPPQINEFGTILYPALTRRGDLYFTRTEAGPKYRLYVSRWSRQGYAPPERVELAGIDEAYDASITLDGERLVFIASIKEGAKERGVFMTRRRGGGWAPPVPVAGHIAGRSQFGTALSADGRTVIFASGASTGADKGREVRRLRLFQLPLVAAST
jgi:hypothetical protein